MPADLFDTYFPFDAGPGAIVTEAQWTQAFRSLTVTGAVAGDGGELAVTVTAALGISVASGAAWIEGHYARNAAAAPFTLAAAHATLSRIDRVVARLDWTANTISVDVLTGAAAASPVVPALTQSATVWEIPLAQVAVAPAAVNLSAGNVTDQRVVVIDNTAPVPAVPGVVNVTVDVTPVAGEKGKLWVVTSATARTFSIPNATTLVLSIGEQFSVMQGGAGQVSFVALSGVTIVGAASPRTRVQYSVMSVTKIAANSWLVSGDLAA